jgi:glycosyltransferase involved in cell wall biosynthesis
MTYRILYHHRIRAEDGQAVHVREMIAALRARGHEVLECALVPKAAGADGSAANGARLWSRLTLPRVATECTEILYSRKGTSMILKAAREFRPDFIYERHALHCKSGLEAAHALDVPLVLEVNSPMCDEMGALGMLHFEKLARRSEREVLVGADRVLPVSDVLARRLVELGAPEERVRVVRNGADPSRVDDKTRGEAREIRGRLGLGNGRFALGFIGYMRPWHRLDLALEALASIDRQDLHLVLVGSGPALPELLRRSEALGLAGRIHSMGRVAGLSIPAICAGFDLALVPAINAYASPLKVFDSLAAAVPTLALDQPNIRELIQPDETGVLFAPGDVASLRDSILARVEDREGTRRLGEAGRASLLANDWTWDGNAGRVIRTFEEVRR